MDNAHTSVVILGGGIAGLSAGWQLHRRDIPFVLLEQSSRLGGMVHSEQIDGFEVENGPNSITLTPVIQSLISELQLADQVVEAAPAGKNRYLLRHGKLFPLSPHPLKILRTPYLSAKAKWKLFTERFVKGEKLEEDESVAAFFERRFGKEVADTVIDPVLSGIYAGDIAALSMQQVMPGLLKWEQEYGSVTRGLMQQRSALGGRKIIGFRGGLNTITEAIYEKIRDEVQLQSEVIQVTAEKEGYLIAYRLNGTVRYLHADNLICTLPAYAAGAVVKNMDMNLSDTLGTIAYPGVWELHLGFEKSRIGRELDGFGFLAAQREQVAFLGCIFSSVLFPFKAPSDKVLLTLFLGGAHQQSLVRSVDQSGVITRAVKEIGQILQISGPPCFEHLQVWAQAIPQLNLGHEKIKKAISLFESHHKKFYFGGNYVAGVSVGDVVKQATRLAEQVVY